MSQDTPKAAHAKLPHNQTPTEEETIDLLPVHQQGRVHPDQSTIPNEDNAFDEKHQSNTACGGRVSTVLNVDPPCLEDEFEDRETSFTKHVEGFYYVILVRFAIGGLANIYENFIHDVIGSELNVHFSRSKLNDKFVHRGRVFAFGERLEGIHRVFCGHRLPKTLCLKVGKERDIIINYNEIDEWTKHGTSAGIKESKVHYGCIDNGTVDYTIYQEHIRINRGLEILSEDLCDVFSDPARGMSEYVSEFAEMVDSSAYIGKREYSYVYPPTESYHGAHCQFYYCKATKIVYGILNKTVRHSNVYSERGSGFPGSLKVYKDRKRDIPYDYAVYKRHYHGYLYLRYPKLHTFFYQNITPPLWIASRYNFIKECCLYGQDNEFNIFRSICFAKPDTETDKMRRFAVGVVCVMLQLCLTIGIATEVIDNWEMLDSDTDDIIIAISIFAFSCISFSYLFTVKKFLQFYISMQEVCIVSWIIIFFDFIANIVIGFIICASSLFFLLQSETVIDAVLNSFALIFVTELDDAINLFEADEDVLMENDWNHYKRNIDWDFKQGKRNINVIPHGCGQWLSLVLYVVISPLNSAWALIHFIWGSVMFCKKHRSNAVMFSDVPVTNPYYY
eukprot:963537_1